jgi:hypothetical protein
VSQPERGNLIRVIWYDVSEDPVGSPESATLSRRTSYGIFWAFRKDHNLDVLVTTTTVDEDGHEQSGYCIYPAANIESIKVYDKGERKRKLRLKKHANGAAMEEPPSAPS